MNNIIDNLHTNDIQRVRIGISKNEIPLIDYVLGKFSKEDNVKLEKVFETICDVIDDFTILDIDKLMDKYNRN